MIRPATLADVPLLYATWIRGERECTLANKLNVDFCEDLHDEIEALLHDPTTRVLMACDDTDPDISWGYIVFALEPAPRVHWMYVKGRLRRVGIGGALLRAALDVAQPFAATHISPIARAILRRCPSLRVTLPHKQAKPRKVATNG